MLLSILLFFVSIEGLRFVKLALGCSSAIGETSATVSYFFSSLVRMSMFKEPLTGAAY